MSACTSEPVSWLRLERYALGELDGAAAAAVRDHLAACPVCHASLARIEADDRALPPLPARAPAPAPRRFWSWPRLAWAGGLLAAAAALLLILRPGRGPAAVAPTTDRIKGGTEVAIELVRDRGGAITAEAATFDAGDRFSVRVTCAATTPVFADVVVFQAGEVSFPLPAAQLRCGNHVSFPGAFTLTGGDAQVCVAIDAARPPDRAAVQAAGPGPLACHALAPPPRAGMCAQLLPEVAPAALVDEVLPERLAAVGCLVTGDDPPLHVYVLCQDELGFAGLITEARRGATDVHELAAGWSGTRDGVPILQFSDDDAPCLVTVRALAGDPAAFARAMAGTLTPALGARIRALAR